MSRLSSLTTFDFDTAPPRYLKGQFLSGNRSGTAKSLPCVKGGGSPNGDSEGLSSPPPEAVCENFPAELFRNNPLRPPLSWRTPRPKGEARWLFRYRKAIFSQKRITARLQIFCNRAVLSFEIDFLQGFLLKGFIRKFLAAGHDLKSEERTFSLQTTPFSA